MQQFRRVGSRRRGPPKQSPIVQVVGIDLVSSLIAGQTAQATATPFQSPSATIGNPNAVVVPNITFTWGTSNASVATVDSSGLVTAVGAGTCNITATAPNGTVGTAALSVTAATPVLTTAVVTAIDQVVIGSTYQAEATGFDENGLVFPSAVWTWTTSNAAIATVNASTGLITPVAAGTCDITATSGSVSDAESITVVTPTPTLTTLTIAPDGAVLTPGATQQMSAVGTYSDASTAAIPAASVTWSETGGGSITSGGLYTAGASPETATITGTVGAVSDDATVTVTSPGTFPSDYDPARLGSSLIVGTRWASVSIGATLAEIKNGTGFTTYPVGGGGGLSAANLVDGQVTCIADSLWGKVMRVCFPGPSKQSSMFAYAQLGDSTVATEDDWFYSTIFRHVGNGCVNGAAPYGYPDAAVYPNGYYSSFGSGVPGGSTTHKHMFAFPPNSAYRLEMVIQNGGYLVLGNPRGSAPSEAIWTSKGTASASDTLVSPSPSPNNFPYGSGDTGNTWRGDMEWYQWVARYKQVGSDSYTAYYHRRLTTNAGTVLSPGGWRFRGWNLVGSGARAWNKWQPLGNKSQSNDGPNDMYIDIAAWEVARGAPAEPYITLDGFGNHL